jgi:hypothetical protein
MRSDALLRGIGVSSGLPKTLVGAPKTLPIPNPGNYTLSGSGSTRNARLALLKRTMNRRRNRCGRTRSTP